MQIEKFAKLSLPYSLRGLRHVVRFEVASLLLVFEEST